MEVEKGAAGEEELAPRCRRSHARPEPSVEPPRRRRRRLAASPSSSLLRLPRSRRHKGRRSGDPPPTENGRRGRDTATTSCSGSLTATAPAKTERSRRELGMRAARAGPPPRGEEGAEPGGVDLESGQKEEAAPATVPAAAGTREQGKGQEGWRGARLAVGVAEVGMHRRGRASALLLHGHPCSPAAAQAPWPPIPPLGDPCSSTTAAVQVRWEGEGWGSIVAMAAALTTLVLDFLATRFYETKHHDEAAPVNANVAASPTSDKDITVVTVVEDERKALLLQTHCHGHSHGHGHVLVQGEDCWVVRPLTMQRVQKN